jgi:catechol 2,3-dioxygenase-like lactoylglutathione lyase family enzyme
MLDHLSIQCADVAASARFYDSVLEAVGGARLMDFGVVIGYGVPSMPDFWLGPRTTGEGFRESHIACTAPNRAAVHEFHRRAVEAGAEVLHEPRAWPQYHVGYFGAFVRDPDGNNVEAVCHLPEGSGSDAAGSPDGTSFPATPGTPSGSTRTGGCGTVMSLTELLRRCARGYGDPPPPGATTETSAPVSRHTPSVPSTCTVPGDAIAACQGTDHREPRSTCTRTWSRRGVSSPVTSLVPARAGDDDGLLRRGQHPAAEKHPTQEAASAPVVDAGHWPQ